MPESFAERLRQIRNERGLSQQQLAMRMFVNRSSVARWENGSRLPDLLLLSRLAECLGVDISALMPETAMPDRIPRVIVVDDEKPILSGEFQMLSNALRDVEITGFTKPSEAIEYARENPVSLAFLDIELGKLNGFELCETLLSINPTTNVIFLTAWADHSLKAWNTGACGFLLKPLISEDIKKVLSKLKYPMPNIFREEKTDSE